jgi:hypothetical protein
VVGTSILLGVLYVRLFLPEMVAEHFIGGAGRIGMMVILIAALSLSLRWVEWRPQWRSCWEASALILLAGDLAAAHWGLNPTVDASYYHRPSELASQLSGSTARTRTIYLPEDEYQAKFTHFFRFSSFQAGDVAHWASVRNSLLPNLGMLDGVHSANNFDPLLVGSYDALIQSLDDLAPDDSTILQALNVGLLLTPTQRGPQGWLCGQFMPPYPTLGLESALPTVRPPG